MTGLGNAPVRFGFTIGQRGVFFGVGSWPEMVALAQRADANPLFHSVWVGDSILAKPRPESIGVLAALATATRRVRLGVGCMASFPIRDPILFAHQWATLDLISDGRMLLAACTGIGPSGAGEGAVYGVKDSQRGHRMAENIAICRRLWSEEDVTFAGKYRSFAGVTVLPRPVQKPCPIWIAANPPPPMAEKPLRRVAQLADGWMSVQVVPGLFAANCSKLEQLLREEGKDPATFPNVAYHNININPDRRAALEESQRFLDAYYGPLFAPPMVEAWTAAGTPAECAEHLQQLARDGAKTIALRITAWDQQGQFERMIGDVLPRVNEAPALTS